LEDPRRYLPGAATPAGWSFLAERPLASVPVPAGFVVEIAVGPTGFLVADRLVAPAAVAKLIAWAKGVSQRPLVLLARGTVPTGSAADMLFGGLADSLGCAVLVADGPVSLTSHGILRTAGVFRQWHPRGGGRLQPVVTPRHRVIGATLPPGATVHRPPPAPSPEPVAPQALTDTAPATQAAPAPVSLTPPAPAAPGLVALTAADHALLDPERWTGRWTGQTVSSPTRPTAAAPAAPRPQPAVPGYVPPRPRTVDSPITRTPATAVPDRIAGRPEAEPVASNAIWISGTDWTADDRTTLRRALNGRYDMYARIVARTLAEEPGLRAAGTSAEVVADLVALCAYDAVERDTVNKTLRTGQRPDGRETLVARGAARGLRRLPAVLGPVFVAGRDTPPVIGRYRAGDELIEPAFVDVDLTRGPADNATVEFVIWSVTARRLDRISPDNAATAVFPPGTRFAVLAVDRSEDGGPVRVLLRDRAGDRPGGDSGSERLLDRLRGAVPSELTGRPQRLLAFAPGLDEHGRRFVPPEAPTSRPLRRRA